VNYQRNTIDPEDNEGTGEDLALVPIDDLQYDIDVVLDSEMEEEHNNQ
jgi:hypothetical protein